MNSRDLLASPRVSLAGTVLAPGLLLLVVRALVGGPSASPAATPAGPTPVASFPSASAPTPTRLTDAQRRAEEWLRQHSPVRAGAWRSPMEAIPRRAAAEPVAAPSAAVQPIVAAEDPLASVKLSTIMGFGHSGFVSVSGKLLRMGDEIAPGWRLTMIDGRNRVIVVSHQNEPDRTLRLEP